ncbi:hypothetical protein [Paraflavitalea sp. CAU 1676]|uniref:DUF7674 family protein n=1 Tax=Paraflavitalea sp. CAU 1676 TaxID=3032598 RepID=UPI0023DB176A|nr:hypothetical protein [Paraflavitalea sp. CAU 1676]MDF2187169.1 hypothetical protein [Paraflavitalea sp. CAU 1676]
MITQYEVPALLKEALPAISEIHYPARFPMDIYKSVQSFSAYTCMAVQEHNHNLVRKCFALADKLYHQGDHLVKNVIENTYVFSFSAFMPKDKVEKLILRSMIPAALYTVYLKQVMGSGC